MSRKLFTTYSRKLTASQLVSYSLDLSDSECAESDRFKSKQFTLAIGSCVVLQTLGIVYCKSWELFFVLVILHPNCKIECDAVIHLEDGRWGPVEIKLGGDKLIDKGAKSLKLLKEKIATKSSECHPSFLMVLTAGGPLYQREDGIYVVPINCLRD